MGVIFNTGLLLVVGGPSLFLTVFTLPEECYYCTTDPDDIWTYDPTCGDHDYNGITKQTHGGFDRCATMIFKSGHIGRSVHSGDEPDGACYSPSTHGGYVGCVCTEGNLCNTGSFCEQCYFPFSTHHTTSATSHISTTEVHSSSTTTPHISTSDVQSTSTPTPETTTMEVLSCYACYDCPQVDDNTQVIQDAEITACVTTLFTSTGKIFRGESHEQVVDGDCRQVGDSLSCWCKSSLCNGGSMRGVGELSS